MSVVENVVFVSVLLSLSSSMSVSGAYGLLLRMALISGVRVGFNERDEGDEGELLC